MNGINDDDFYKAASQCGPMMRGMGYFFLYVVLTAIFQFGQEIVLITVADSGGLQDGKLITESVNNNILGMTVISGILTILVLFLIFKLRKKDIKQEWRLNKFRMRDVLAASATSFCFSFLFSLFTYNSAPMENAIMIHKSAEYYSELFPMLGFILIAVNLLLIAPAAEEIALRGIVYTRIAGNTNTIVTIAYSSVLFGIMHFAAGGTVLVVGATLMAAVFGYIFHKFDSLWICIIAHAVANLPDFILYYHPDISGIMLWGLRVFFACSFAAGMYGIYKMKRPEYY